jgi:hypothetical protein
MRPTGTESCKPITAGTTATFSPKPA